MSHSPEPWRIRYYEEPWVPEAFGTHDIVDANGNVVSAEYHPNEQQDRSVEAAPERLKRIVACVNALAGVPNEHIEAARTVLAILRGTIPDDRIDPNSPAFESTFPCYVERVCRVLRRGVQQANADPPSPFTKENP